MKKGVCGSLESNDCLITAQAAEKTEIVIESTVIQFYGEQIRKVIMDTLDETGHKNVWISCVDRGALDYTIRARLLTALARMEEA
jgi:citrate lyase subunit gamma (acyl carrier protein)